MFTITFLLSCVSSLDDVATVIMSGVVVKLVTVVGKLLVVTIHSRTANSNFSC